ncbi:MAG: VOC family protein, partial [Terriglobales bacterium]
GFPFTQAVSFFVSCRDVARHFLPWSLPLVARSAGFDSRQGPPDGAQDSSKLPPQEEIDYYWARLSDGGKEIQCGWLADRFGLSWQIVPEGIMDLVQHPAAFQAMMGMVKMDIAALRKAAGNKSGPLLPPPRVDV